jgi:hypothetical protein
MAIRAANLVMAAVLVLGSAPAAFAQSPVGTNTPTFELSAGYQFTRVPDQNFPFGLAIDGARHWGALGVVGEAGWARHADEELGIDFSTNLFHFAAGPRWTGFRPGRVWPYAQVLVGAAVANSSLDINGVGADETETAFLVQPGVGVTVIGGDGWGVFGQVDYRRTFFDEDDDDDGGVNNQFRIFLGLRLILD